MAIRKSHVQDYGVAWTLNVVGVGLRPKLNLINLVRRVRNADLSLVRDIHRSGSVRVLAN